MEKAIRRRYTLEYKHEAVRLVHSGQKVSAAAKALGIVEQTLANWVKTDKRGQLRGLSSEQVSAERMENNRPRAERERVGISSAPGAAEEDTPTVPSVRDGLAGRDSRGLH